MQPMKFMKLEGNYIVAFRDTATDSLNAFTAVRLDRTRRRKGSATPELSPASRRRISPPGHATLVITGVPAYVSLDVIKGLLEDVIPGIVRVYRESETSTIPKPPIFVQTNRGIAVDAFMLRSDWIREIDHVVNMASSRVPQIVVNNSEDEVTVLAPEIEITKPEGLCPHGSYEAAGTCLQCLGKKGRRSTFISDAAIFRGDRKGSAGSVDVEAAAMKEIGGLYALKQRRRNSYEIPVRLDELKSR